MKHGFVLAFFWLLVLNEDDPKAYFKAMKGTIEQGGDTDTNACIVGGLVGAFLGLQKLPESMVSKTLSFDCEHIQIRNNKPLGILRPALFNQKTRLIPSIQALIKLRAKPNDKLKITQKEVKEFYMCSLDELNVIC